MKKRFIIPFLKKKNQTKPFKTHKDINIHDIMKQIQKVDNNIFKNEFISLFSRFKNILKTQNITDEQKIKSVFIVVVNNLFLKNFKKNNRIATFAELFAVIEPENKLVVSKVPVNSPLFNEDKIEKFLERTMIELKRWIFKFEQNPDKFKESEKNPFTTERATKSINSTLAYIQSKEFGKPEKDQIIKLDENKKKEKIKYILNLFKTIKKLCEKYDSSCFDSFDKFKNEFLNNIKSPINKYDFNLIKQIVEENMTIDNAIEINRDIQISNIFNDQIQISILDDIIQSLEKCLDIFKRELKDKKVKQSMPSIEISGTEVFGNESKTNQNIKDSEYFRDIVDIIKGSFIPHLTSRVDFNTIEGKKYIIKKLYAQNELNIEDLNLMLELYRDNYKWKELVLEGLNFKREDCLLFKKDKELLQIKVRLSNLANKISNMNTKS